MYDYILQLSILLGHSFHATLMLVVQVCTMVTSGIIGSTLIMLFYNYHHTKKLWSKGDLVRLFKAWLIVVSFGIISLGLFILVY